MQSTQRRTVVLLLALAGAACGDSADTQPDFLGFVDSSALDSKFLPTAKCTTPAGSVNCYPEQRARVAGAADVFFYPVGLTPLTALTQEPASSGNYVLPAKAATVSAYDFPEACSAGKEFDAAHDTYREDQQGAVFDALPLTSTSTPPALVVPLVKVALWSGLGETQCNSIRSTTSLKEGAYGGAAEETSTLRVRPVIDVAAYVQPLPGRAPAARVGWFKGLQLAYFDGGPVTVDDKGNVGLMDAVLLQNSVDLAKKPSVVKKVTDTGAFVLLSAAPGGTSSTGVGPGWSPVVRLYELTVATPDLAASYTGLCYAQPCPAEQLDMVANAKSLKLSGLLFLAESAQ